MERNEEFPGWECMEAMHLLTKEEKATSDQCREIVEIGRAICFDSEDYVVGGVRGPERAVRFIDGDKHITVATRDSRRYCDLDITIDSREPGDIDLVRRQVFEVQNASWLHKNHAKISVTPTEKFLLDQEEVNLNDFFPKNIPSWLYSWRARADYCELKGRSISSSEFTIADYESVRENLLAYSAFRRIFAQGKEACDTLRNDS